MDFGRCAYRRLAEEALQRLNEELEDKVKQRPAELGETNNQLKEEITQRLRYEGVLKDYQEKLQALNIDIIDEGVGFDDAHLELMMLDSYRYGLFSIRERIRYLGGVFEVKSEKGRGTRSTMFVELESEEELDDIQKIAMTTT